MARPDLRPIQSTLTDEALVSELEARAAKMPAGLKTRLTAALAEGTRPRLENALAGTVAKEAEMPQAKAAIKPEIKVAMTPEAKELAALKVYAESYSSLPNNIRSRNGCTWGKITKRLLENGGEKLRKAEAMQGGGQLFGVDTDGMALIKDKGVEPVMYGYDLEGKLIQIYERDPEEMKKIVKWAAFEPISAQVLNDGYEFFPGGQSYPNQTKFSLSDEIQQAKDHTKEPFVASKDGSGERRHSWLKPVDGDAVWARTWGNSEQIYSDGPQAEEKGLSGVIRLLRV